MPKQPPNWLVRGAKGPRRVAMFWLFHSSFDSRAASSGAKQRNLQPFSQYSA